MKNYFNFKKAGRIIGGSLLGIVLSVLFVSSIQGQTAPDIQNDYTKNLTVRGKDFTGQTNAIDLVKLAPKPQGYIEDEDTRIFNQNDSTVAGQNSLFYVAGATIIDRIATLYQSRFTDYLYIGFDTVQNPSVNDPKLQVNGAITIKELSDPNRTTPERVCVSDLGRIALCVGDIDTTLITSEPGSCAEYTEEYLSQPASNDITGCLVGEYQNETTDPDLQWSWRCEGVDGGTTAYCFADKLIELDDLGIGGTSASISSKNIFAWLTGARIAEASSSICSERNNLNDNGIYKRTGSIYVRYGDQLPLLIDDGSGLRKSIDYTQLQSGSLSNGAIKVYDGVDLTSASVLPNGEYIISGDSVINETRDPLTNPDGFIVRHGTPISAVSLVVSSEGYVFENCGEENTLSNDQIRTLDIAAIRQKLEEYYQQNGAYPASGGAIIHYNKWSNSANTSSWNTLGNALGVDLPVDPINNAEVSGSNITTATNHQYHYFSSTSDTNYGCGPNQWYMISYNPEEIASPQSNGAQACSQNFNYGGTVTVGTCKDPACNASWVVQPSSWNDVQCNPQTGTKVRSVSCQGTDGLLTAETNCWRQPRPESQINCTVNAICRVYSGSYDIQPANNMSEGCLSGNYIDNANIANQWRWQCAGLNGGTTSNCTSTRTTYIWQTGLWGTCNQQIGEQIRTVTCRASTGGDALESRCTGTRPPDKQDCGVDAFCRSIPGSFESNPATSTSAACNPGVLQNPGSTSNTWVWQCAGLNGGQTVSCSATRTTFAWVITIPNPQNPNNPDGWGICPESTHLQTREVRCKASTGDFVADGKCSTPKPPISQACLTNDEIRALDVSFIKQKLEDYYQVNGVFPSTSGAIEPNGGWSNSSHSSWDTISGLLGVTLPVDPINTPELDGNWSNEYRYHYYGSGGYGCAPGQWYMLVYNPEGVENPISQGAQACNQDFQYNGTITTGSCKDPACNSTWQTAPWGSCQNDGNKYRDVICVGSDGQATAEANCWRQTKPTNKLFCGLIHLNATTNPTPFTSNSSVSIVQDPTTPSNAIDGSDVYRIDGSRWLVSTDLVEIDPSKIYTLSGNFKSIGAEGNSDIYLSLYPYDENIRYIGVVTEDKSRSNENISVNSKPETSEVIIESFTGTTITTNGLGNLSQWSQNGSTSAMSIGFYYNGDISKYPDAVVYGDSYVTASGVTINLTQPIHASVTSKIIPGVTAIKNHYWSGDPRPAASNASVPNTWTTYSGSITKEVLNYGDNNFPLGTRYARVLLRANSSQNETFSLHVDDIKLWESGAQPVINGSCASLPSNYANKPYTSDETACNNGSTRIEKTSTGSEWRWRCMGYSGGAESQCTAKRILNGVCGTSSGTTNINQPTFNCKWGNSVAIDSLGEDGTWNWECQGVNTGTTASCSANRVLNGTCKTYTSQYAYTSQPGTTNVTACAVGTFSEVSDDPGSWKWDCNGIHGGTNARCSAARVTYEWETGNWGSCDPYAGTQTRSVFCNATPVQIGGNPVSSSLCDPLIEPSKNQSCLVHGSCKSYSSTDGYLTQPATNTLSACNAGAYNNATPADTSNTWFWSCDGLNGGNRATCSAQVRADGVCGSTSGNTYTTRPFNECAVGTSLWIDAVGADGEWNWSCTGYGAGSIASCSANYKREAICSSYSGAYDDQPATTLAAGCATASSYTDLSDTSTLFRWQCGGWHGGGDAICTATRYTYAWNSSDWGVCNPSTGIRNRTVVCNSNPAPPEGNPVPDGKCSGLKPPVSQNCPVNPICKPYLGNYESTPATGTANGCNAGTYSILSSTVDTFKWRCNALNGGTPASIDCSANWKRNAVCKAGLSTTPSSSQPATSDITGCDLGTYTNQSNTAHLWQWRCNGYNTGANAACTAPATYSWNLGEYSACNSTTAMKTRTVSCISSTGSTVDGSYCGVRPPIEEFCGILHYNANENANPFSFSQSFNDVTDTFSVVSDSTNLTNNAWGPNVYEAAGGAYYYSDFIDVDPSNIYTLSGNFKSVGTAASPTYFGFIPYDENGNQFSASTNADRFPAGEDAVVKSFSDTSIVTNGIADLTTWQTSAAAGDARSIGFYYDGDISKVPDYTLYNNAYNDASGDTITLGKVIPGSIASNIIPGITVIKNHSWTTDPRVINGWSPPTGSWGSYAMSWSQETFENEWTTRFPYGTRKVKILIRANYYDLNTNSAIYFNDIKFWVSGTQPLTNGSCKTFNSSYGGKPANSTSTACNNGTYLERTSTAGEWRWMCKGYSGGTDSLCSANRVTPGECNNSYTGNYNSQPGTNTANACIKGLFVEVTDGTTIFNWNCEGPNGGIIDSCSAKKIVNAICNTSYTGNYTAQQASSTINGCVQGTYLESSDIGDTFNWVCVGANTGLNAACSHKKQMPGICTNFTNDTYTAQPGTTLANACGPYNSSYNDRPDTSSEWKWDCVGANAGSTANCVEYKPPVCKIIGQSGTKIATSTATGCEAGNFANGIDFNTTWNWSCVNNGAAVACESPRSVPGICVNFTKDTYESQPGTTLANACGANNDLYTDTADSQTQWNWACRGVNGGSTLGCSEYKQPICAAFNSNYSTQPANSTNGCSAGTFTETNDGTTTFNWTCSNNGVTSPCSANKIIPPGCGSFPGNYSTQPANSANGCSANNTYTDVPDVGTEWRWSCTGINGGATISCSASPVYTWTPGVWGSCSLVNGMKTRTVTCVSSTGPTVSDIYCANTKLPTQEFCGLLNLNANQTSTPFTNTNNISIVSDPTVPSNSPEQNLGPNVYRITTNYGTYISSIQFPVDPSKIYTIAGSFKSAGAANSRLYFGLSPYDTNSNFISHQDTYRKPDAQDAVIQSFNSTSITTDNISDLSTWYQSGTAVHVRSIAFYYDGDISKLPDYVFYADKYSSISGNVINLTTAIPGSVASQIIPGTTTITNNQGGAGYLYTAASYASVPTTWTEFSGEISLEHFSRSSDLFRYGTRFARILILPNYVADSQDLRFNDLRIWESGAQPLTNGACGALPGSYLDKPYIDSNTSSGCASGTIVPRTSTDTQWRWSCQGYSGGSTANCSANRSVNAVCNTSYSGNYTSQPGTNTSNGCVIGSYTDISDTTTQWRWNCTGINAGSTSNCTSFKQPICASFGNSFTQGANTSTGCTAGTYGDTGDTTTTFNWNCSNNGVTVACTSPKAVNGVCTNFPNATYTSQPGTTTANGCSAGNWAEAGDNTNEWKWQCNGFNGGTNSSCTEYKPTACKTPTPGPSYTQPATSTATGCNVGAWSNATDTATTWNWTCTNNGSAVSCNSLKRINGVCTPYGGTYSSQPATTTANACNAGAFVNTPANTTHSWNWSCNGINTGTNATNCSATPTYYWEAGGFGGCNNSTAMKTRTVVCKSIINNATVTDSYCSGAGGKPMTEQFCGLLHYNATTNPAPFNIGAQGSGATFGVVQDSTTPSNAAWGSDVYRAQGGSYYYAQYSDYIDVDPSKIYTLSGNFKSVGADSSPLYFGFLPMTADGTSISTNPSAYDNPPQAQDAVVQSVSDTAIVTNGVADLSSWMNDTTGTYWLHRTIGFYYDGNIAKLPDYSQYRTDGVYSSISGDTINLTAPLPASVTSQIIPGTTVIRNHYYVSVDPRVVNGSVVPNTWTNYSSDYSTEAFGPEWQTRFPYGTRKVRILIRANHYLLPTTAAIHFDDIKFWESGAQPFTNGVCKVLSGDYQTKPYWLSESGCTSGTILARTSTPSEWRWMCKGYSGGSDVLCSASRGTNGRCNASYTGNYNSQPASNTGNGCLLGVYAEASDGANTYNWTCNGFNNGNPDSCSAKKIVNAACRTSYTGNYSTQQATTTANGCTLGTYSDTGDTQTTFNWSCVGANTGTTVQCVHKRQVAGLCTNFPNAIYTSQPGTTTANACGSFNTYTDISDTTTQWRWNCTGINAGSTASCIEYKQPICASFGNSFTQGANTSTGCTAGTYGDTGDTTTTFNWNCSNNGVTVACTSPKSVNGSCSSYTGNYGSQPANSGNGCSTGIYTDTGDSTNSWNWSCMGVNGGTTSSCQANRIVNGACNAFTGNYSSQPANSSNGCTAGTYNDTPADSSVQWNWSCGGSNTGSTSSCYAKRIAPGVCKSYGGSHSSQPGFNTSNGCIVGIFQENSDISTAWQWSCFGVNTGANALCQETPTYTWNTTGWGTCSSAGSQTRSVWCQSAAGGTVSPGTSYCTGAAPATSQPCPVSPVCRSYGFGGYGSQQANYQDATGCDRGTYSDLADVGDTFNWRCTGINVATVSNCSHKKIMNPGCTNFTNTTYSSQPGTTSANACIAHNTYGDVGDTTNEWKWNCTGNNGGSTASCTEYKPPVCKTLGASYSQTATTTASGCNVGSWANASDTATTFNWSCNNNGASVSCNSPKRINGVCLNYTGTHYGAKPGTNTATGCSAGTFSNTPADTSIQWNWSCIGINAGTTASCSESRIPPGKLVELHSQYSGKVKNIIQSPYYVSVISSSMYNEVVYCAIRADNGTLECGGGSATFVANAPVGQVIKEMAVNIDWDSNRMCVIKGNDDLYCWGPGGNNLPANKKAKQVSVGKDGLCWINLNDTVECHGSGSGGGFAGANPSAGLTAKSISVSQDYACAIKFDNTSECWTGPNQAGSTGYRLSLWNNNSGSGCSGGGCASSTFKQMFPVEGICGIRMNNTLACTSDSDRAGLGGSTTVSSGYTNFRHSCWFQSSNNHMKCNYSGYPENTNWLSSIYYLDSNAGKGCGIKPNGENICWPYYQDDIGVEIITENQPQPFQVIRRIINSSGVSRGYVLTPI